MTICQELIFGISKGKTSIFNGGRGLILVKQMITGLGLYQILTVKTYGGFPVGKDLVEVGG